MKNSVEQQAYNIAFRALLRNGYPKCDLRTKIGKMTLNFYNKMKSDTVYVSFAVDARAKRNARFENRRYKFTNILDCGMTKDYITCKRANALDWVEIYPDRMAVGNRNHWAHTERDRKILSVLSKYK